METVFLTDETLNTISLVDMANAIGIFMQADEALDFVTDTSVENTTWDSVVADMYEIPYPNFPDTDPPRCDHGFYGWKLAYGGRDNENHFYAIDDLNYQDAHKGYTICGTDTVTAHYCEWSAYADGC